MRIRHRSWAVRAAILPALAGGSAAFAVPPGAKDRAAEDGPTPFENLLRSFNVPQQARGSTPADLSGAWGAVSRGAGGADVGRTTLDTGFESLDLLPAELVGQRDVVMWGGASASVTGRNVFAAATAPLTIPRYGVVSDAIAGNATKKLRGFVAPPAYGVNAFFGRWCRYDFVKANSPTGGIGTRFVFRPDVSGDLRASSDFYVNSITSLWTSEPTYVSSGFIVSRLLWGGQNATSGIGLPVGPIPDFFTLNPNQGCQFLLCPIFLPCQTPAFYRSGEPFPGGAGQNVPVPINSWFTIIHETTIDGLIRHVLDRHDGHGEFVIFEAMGLQVGRIDRMAYACGQEVDNDACYVDNIHVDGVEFTLPVAPDLVCGGACPPGQPCCGSPGGGGEYRDDERWLFPVALAGQSTRWVDALSSHANVILDDVPAGDQAIRRTNFFNDDRYRQEIRTLLPLTYATGVGPFRLCIPVTLSNSVPAPNMTVQAIAPASVTDGQFVSRLFIGRFDPFANPAYTPRMYVQTNPDYNPIDDENTVDPYNPGPSGNGGVPIIGVDVADTGVDWVFNSQRTVCFDVAENRALTVSVNGVTVHTGSAFVNSIDQLHLESENNQPGAGNPITYDDVVLSCTVLPGVFLPPFSLVYRDDLEWGLEGVTIGVQDDDCNPATPFKWSSAANMPIVSLTFDVTSKVLRMENLFRDTPAVAPNKAEFAQFQQAATALPHVSASATRGWAARSENRLTDAATSRIWTVAQATIASSQFARCTAIAFSSFTGTFWIQVPAHGPDPFADTWIDSGASLSAAGTGLNQWFSLSTHRNLNSQFTYRINGRLLRFVGGPSAGLPVKGTSLASLANGTHKDMDRLQFFASDEDTAPSGSILYVDNILAWSLPCLGDTNDDGVVNFNDLNNVLGFFGMSAAANTDITGNIGPDADHDGVPDDLIVNFTDLNLVLSGFGIPCSASP